MIARISSLLFMLYVSALPITAYGETAADTEASETPDGQPAEPTGVDLARDAISRSANDAAKWFDAFFGDERYVAEEARSRIRLIPSLFYEEGESLDTRFRVSARIWLPRLSKRMRLVIANTSEEEESLLDKEVFPDAGSSEEISSAIGLQYFLKTMERTNINLTAGLKRGDEDAVDFFIGPRYRRIWRFDNWQLRFTERAIWFADLGWESRTRLDYEKLLHDELFFRTSTELRWSEEDFDENGFQLAVTPTISQRLKSRAGVDYQLINVFQSRPDKHLDSTTLRVRYRQRIWRKWLFYEVNPQLAFRDEDDFDTTPGIELRLEASFSAEK